MFDAGHSVGAVQEDPCAYPASGLMSSEAGLLRLDLTERGRRARVVERDVDGIRKGFLDAGERVAVAVERRCDGASATR